MSATGQPAGGPSASVRGPLVLRLTALVLAVEATGLVTLGLVDLWKVLTGTPRSMSLAVGGALLAVGTGALVLLVARAVLRRRGWAYSPALVLQLLALPVGYSLAVQAGVWRYGGPVLLLAVAGLGLLFAPPVRGALITPR